MIEVRRSAERGFADHGWLQSYHTFSFADYYDHEHTAFGPLRVINEDRVQPSAGFGTHGHRDMEIVSYVLEGELAHKDSMGTGSVIRPGDVQRMSAGRGVTHSEFNPSDTRIAHFLQIWILPNVQGGPPSYEQKHFSIEDKRGRLCLIAAPESAQGAVRIQQDARIYAGLFDGAEALHLAWDPMRRLYVHLARGTVNVNGKLLGAGDAVRMTGASRLDISGGAGAEVLVFDLPGDRTWS